MVPVRSQLWSLRLGEEGNDERLIIFPTNKEFCYHCYHASVTIPLLFVTECFESLIVSDLINFSNMK